MATIGALGACCLAAVGCGSGGNGAQGPLANQTGAQVLAQAVADLNAARSVRMDGTAIGSGLYVTFSTGVVPGKGCTGTIMFGFTGAQGIGTYITAGETMYFKLDSNMWQGLEGANGATIAQLLGGKYVKDQLSDRKLPLQGVGDCAITNPKNWAGAVAKGQVTTLNGIWVLPLKDSRGDVMYVTDTSKPRPVQEDLAPLPGTTDPAGETTFTVGVPVTLTPPPVSQVVNGATLGM